MSLSRFGRIKSTTTGQKFVRLGYSQVHAETSVKVTVAAELFETGRATLHSLLQKMPADRAAQRHAEILHDTTRACAASGVRRRDGRVADAVAALGEIVHVARSREEGFIMRRPDGRLAAVHVGADGQTYVVDVHSIDGDQLVRAAWTHGCDGDVDRLLERRMAERAALNAPDNFDEPFEKAQARLAQRRLFAADEADGGIAFILNGPNWTPPPLSPDDQAMAIHAEIQRQGMARKSAEEAEYAAAQAAREAASATTNDTNGGEVE